MSRILLYTVVLCAALHVGSVFLVNSNSGLLFTQLDAFQYTTLAQNVLEGNGFSASVGLPFEPQVYRTPGYPLFLATLFVIDSSGTLIPLAQQILLIGAALFIALLVRNITRDHILALCAALFVLLEPRLWVLSLNTMSETLFLFTFSATAYLLFTHTHRMRAHAALVGFLSGTLLYIRPITTLYIPFLMIGVYLVHRSFTALLVYIGVLLLVVSPWVVRNYELVGYPLFSTTTSFNIIYGLGSDEEKKPLYNSIHAVDENQIVIGVYEATYADELQQWSSAVLDRVGVFGFVSAQLACTPTVWFGHYYDFFLSEMGVVLTPIMKLFVVVFDYVLWGSVLFLVCLGTVVLVRKRQFAHAVVLGGIVGATLFANLCLSDTRMQLAVLFAVIALAAIGISTLKHR